MKNLKMMICALGVLVAVIGCKKDDDGGTTTPPSVYGTFSYDNTSYTFQKAYGQNYGIDSSISPVTNIDLNLFSDGIDLFFDQGDLDSLAGSGVYIYLEAFTANTNSFSDGVYSFDDTGANLANSFSDFSDILVGNVTTGNYVFYSISGGTFTVSTNASSYTIVFDLLLENGKRLTGTYTGIIEIK